MLGNRISSRTRMASRALRVTAAADQGTPLTSSTERTNRDRSGFPGRGDGPPPGGGPRPPCDAVGTGLGDSLGVAEGDDPLGVVDGVGETTGWIAGGPVGGPVTGGVVPGGVVGGAGVVRGAVVGGGVVGGGG